MVYLHDAPQDNLFASAGNGWMGNGWIRISCRFRDTYKDVSKHCLHHPPSGAGRQQQQKATVTSLLRSKPSW